VSKIADNPYPGSRAFTQADQAFFFGRDADTAVIVDLWTTNRLTVVSGPVASGKTSLLHASVYPSMPVKRSRVLPAGNLFYGMTFPFPALPEHNPFTLALLRSWSPDDVPTRLAGLSVSDFVRRFARGEDGAIYAAIDQLDDLFPGSCHSAWAKWRQQFLTELTQAMADHPRLHLLLVTRDEPLALLTSAVGGGAQHAITALTTRAAVEAVTRPAIGAGRSFAEAAAHSLIDDLRRTPGSVGLPAADRVEPSLLQAVCRRLWEELPLSDTEISAWTIGEFSDADTALATRCGQVIGEVAALHGISSKELRSWLVDNFATGGGTREDAQTTAGQPNAVPRDLLDRHLLTGEIKKSVRYYRLLSRRLAEPLRTASVERPAPPTAAGYLRAAKLDLARGELDLAQTHGERARDLLPDSSLQDASSLQERAQVESLLGNVAHRRGEPGKALPHYRQAAGLLQAMGDTHAAAHQLAAVGQILLAGGEPADALPELRAAVEREPSDLGLQTRLALALWQAGDGRAAVAILNWVLTMDGGHAEARRARGEILADLGEGRSAILDLDGTAPGHPSSRAARGLALAELGDHTAAAEEINRAMADARRSGPVLLYAARAFDLAGDKVSAKDRAGEAIEATDPPLSQTHKQLALQLAGHRPGFTKSYPRRS
jgi:tetratricopeptide (TPR) repeat protein